MPNSVYPKVRQVPTPRVVAGNATEACRKHQAFEAEYYTTKDADGKLVWRSWPK